VEELITKPLEDAVDTIDEIDYIQGENKINYSLTQYLYEMHGKTGILKRSKLKVEQEFYIDKARSNHPDKKVFSPVWIDLDTHPFTGIDWNHQLTYGVYGEGVTEWDTQLSMHPPDKIWGVSGSYHYSKDPDQKFLIVEPSLVLGPMSLWGALRYDAEQDYMAEREARITWHSECWELSLSYLSVDNRGNDAKDETKISFLLTLKGVGTIGRKR
jgi:lipopolysaccharide assembly outer membrane protein LptD (OstA)